MFGTDTFPSISVSIIIVSFNTKNLLLQSINSIHQHVQTINYEIIIVDNASTDGSQAMVREGFPHIKLFENKTNLGFGAANNIGIRNSNGKYIFLLNPDTILENDVLKIFFDFMENSKNEHVWCCGGKIFDNKKNLEISYGNFPSLSQIIFEFGFHKVFPIFYQENLSTTNVSTSEYPKQVDYISGANMFIRNSVLSLHGLFDEDFFLYYEETELSFRMKKNGYQAIMLPDAHIIHLHGQSSKALPFTEKLKIIETSKYLFFKKCYGTLSMKTANILYILKYLLLLIRTRDKIFKQYILFSISFLFNFSKYKDRFVR